MVLYASLDDLSRDGILSPMPGSDRLTFRSHATSTATTSLEPVIQPPPREGDDAWLRRCFDKLSSGIFLVPLVFHRALSACYRVVPAFRLDAVTTQFASDHAFMFGATTTRAEFLQRVMADVGDAIVALHRVHGMTHGHIDAQSIVFHDGRWTLQIDTWCKPHDETSATTDILQYVALLRDVLLPRVLPAKCDRIRDDSTTHIRTQRGTPRICSLRDVQNVETIGGPLPNHVSIAHFYAWFACTIQVIMQRQQATTLLHDTLPIASRSIEPKEWLRHDLSEL